MAYHPPRAFPLGVAPPVGTCQSTGKHRRSARGRRPRRRTCLRKGCGRKYQPRRWNQRYCQAPECLREVRRWQAARRQAKRRQDARIEVRHAQAEKERRQRAKVAPKTVENPEVAPARGHAAKPFFLLPYAIGRAATYRPRPHLATRHASVAPPAGRRFAMSWIVNVSGALAAPWMAGRSGLLNTGPHAGTDPCVSVPPPSMCRRGHPRNDDAPRCAGRQLSRGTARFF
jgi:hypothetical protein